MNSYNRSGSKEKAQIVRENHKKIVELINSEINECDKGDENSNTVWGDPCKSEWVANNIIKYVTESLNLTNPYSEDSPAIKSNPGPRIQAESQAGQSTEMGVIFVMENIFNLSLVPNGLLELVLNHFVLLQEITNLLLSTANY